MGEDQYFLLLLLNREPEIIFVDQIFYEYCQDFENSITSSKIKIYELVYILKLELGMKNYSNKYTHVKYYFTIKQIFTLLRYGDPVSKIRSIGLAIYFIANHSPKRYMSSAKFVGKILRNTVKQ